MENRIKEQQLSRTAHRRPNCGRIRSDYIFLRYAALRRLGLAGTKMARAQAGTIRLRLLKIGARIGSRRVRCGRWRRDTPGPGSSNKCLERGEPLRC